MTPDTSTSLPNAITTASRLEPDTQITREVRGLISHMLGDGMSVIDPQTRIWTAEAAEDLRSRIADDPMPGSNHGQWEKLDVQLNGAPRAVVLLAAEMVFLREQPVRNARPETRRAHVERVLELLPGEPIQIPDAMSDALNRPKNIAGFRSGQSYNGGLAKHIAWLSTFICHWAALSPGERSEARDDPWALQRVMLESGPDQPDIRNALQFLIAPQTFELISYVSLKKTIRDRLADRIGGASGDDAAALDRDLLAIRAALAQEVSFPFHFWTPGIEELWNPDAAQSSDEASADMSEPRMPHYWLYSPGQGASEWPRFAAEGIMVIAWGDLGDLAQYPDRESIRLALASEDATATARNNDALALWQFQHEIKIGDVVYAKRGRREIVGRGVVTSEPRYEPERDAYPHVISVDWTFQGSWPHPGDAVTKTLTDITKHRDYVETLEELVAGEDETQLAPAPKAAPTYGKEDFLDQVFLDEASYERLRSLLSRKKNIILAGPPGVGKTYAAKRLAYSIIGAKDPRRVESVQFHQSYSYEDFMMGYRPTASGGFELTEGPFYRFCDVAREDDADRPYFFIIDEINRGNISKIFGELLMLIEGDKRGQELRLLYKNELFTVPPNLYIIGMMNTADRSLAVMDYALRRRFGFFNMKPGFGSQGFQDWMDEADNPAFRRLIDTVVELNSAIADDPALGVGFQIGHSFFCAPSRGIQADYGWLTSIVEDELIPLLEEYWFDEPQKVFEWSGKLRAALT